MSALSDPADGHAGTALLVDELAAEIAIDLHGLCQPLTALQCRLEIGRMEATLEGLDAAIVDALRECVRVNALVRAMQDKVFDSKRHEMAGER